MSGPRRTFRRVSSTRCALARRPAAPAAATPAASAASLAVSLHDVYTHFDSVRSGSLSPSDLISQRSPCAACSCPAAGLAGTRDGGPQKLTGWHSCNAAREGAQPFAKCVQTRTRPLSGQVEACICLCSRRSPQWLGRAWQRRRTRGPGGLKGHRHEPAEKRRGGCPARRVSSAWSGAGRATGGVAGGGGACSRARAGGSTPKGGCTSASALPVHHQHLHAQTACMMPRQVVCQLQIGQRLASSNRMGLLLPIDLRTARPTLMSCCRASLRTRRPAQRRGASRRPRSRRSRRKRCAASHLQLFCNLRARPRGALLSCLCN